MDSKPYKFTIERGEDYIYVHLTGYYDEGKEYEQSMDFLGQVLDRCKKEKVNKIHIVVAMTHVIPVLTAFRITKEPELFGWEHELVLAFTFKDKDTLKIGKFIETVAVNRSYKVKVFNSIEDASKWLKEQ